MRSSTVEDVLNLVAGRIRELRTGHVPRLSQAELARRAGISIGTLNSIEKRRWAPGLDVLARIATALGVSMDQLWAGALPPPPRKSRVNQGVLRITAILEEMPQPELRKVEAFTRLLRDAAQNYADSRAKKRRRR
jgi:transcriptional regulator with XRE-family HTH domain